VLLWDRTCPLQRLWIERVRAIVGEAIEIREAERLALIERSERSREEYEGAHAIYRALAYSRSHRFLLSLYLGLPLFGRVSDWILAHPDTPARLTGLLIGTDVRPAQQILVRWLFLRALGVASAVAFLSIAVQLDGLFGPQGIAPVETLARMAADAARAGEPVYREHLSLFFLRPTMGMLHGLAWTGVAASTLLIVDLLPAVAVLIAWACYLSLVTVGSAFLRYQWDALLLESFLVAAFVAPLRVLPTIRGDRAPRRLGIWLLRLLVVKLMFLSGVVKLNSGDPTWRNLSALDYHYFTQPLPFAASAWVASLPRWMHRGAVLATYAIELGAPLLVFGPRRLRWLACALFVALQISIATSGSYGFFNLLTVALCVSLLDDDALRFSHAKVAPRKPNLAYGALASIVLFVSASESCARVRGPDGVPKVAVKVAELAAPLHSIHAYGLFSVMTTTRREIILEGSADGVAWKPYVFRYKPGPIERVPRYAWFHLPRLDWQMWFAALVESCEEAPWTLDLSRRLLEGSPAVLALLEENPFPTRPPLFLRSTSWEYRFGSETFWVRSDPRRYCPTVTLQGGQLLVVEGL
jgi:hypothetical protein